MGKSCLLCGGTRILTNGLPCPDCSKELLKEHLYVDGIPVQYQGKAFERDFLPNELAKSAYADFMEKLFLEITSNISVFQKNYLIISRPNSGKTVWAYSLYSQLSSKGYRIPLLRDIEEVKSIMSYQGSMDEADLYNNARCVIIKIPSGTTPWSFETLRSIVERRVRNNGFTLFLYSGTLQELERADRNNILRDIKGTGAFNTILIKDYGRKE